MKKSLANAAKGLVTGGIAAVLASGAFAATQGTPGFTSTGTLDISIIVDDEVRISGLSNISLGTFAGGDESDTSTACIYRNSATTYQITASGNGVANAFTLTDGTFTVPYSVSFADDAAATAPASLTSGVSLIGQDGADTDVDCTVNGSNAVVGVTVTAADAASLPAGNYLGTLTLVVAPN